MASAVFYLHILYRSRSQQLQEAFIMSLAGAEKVNTAKIKMDLRLGGGFKYCRMWLNTAEMSS